LVEVEATAEKNKVEIGQLLDYIEQQPLEDVLPKNIQEEILRVFPELSEIILNKKGKLEHVFQVVNYMLHLKQGDMDYFLNRLKVNDTTMSAFILCTIDSKMSRLIFNSSDLLSPCVYRSVSTPST